MKKKAKLLITDHIDQKLKNKNEIYSNPELIHSLEKTNLMCDNFFSETNPSYHDNLEHRIIEKIISFDTYPQPIHTIWTRAGIILTSVLFFMMIIWQTSLFIQKKKIEEHINQYITLNYNTIDFIVTNNFDTIVQQIIQNNGGTSLMNDDDLQSMIEQSLLFYLSLHLNQEILSSHKGKIIQSIEKHSKEYLNYIKNNSEKILI